jgi:lipopolysaccharide/colanic/teichoic acid biosynthesis glycosyltransferase
MQQATLAQATGEAHPELANPSLYPVTQRRFLGRLRYQLLVGIILAVILPPVLYFLGDVEQAWRQSTSVGTAIGNLCAFLIAIYLFRRAISFPGVGIVGHVFPAVSAGYGMALMVFFGLRLDYSGLIFALSVLFSTLFFFSVSTYLRNRKDQRFYVIPSPSTASMPAIRNVQWVFLREPRLPADPAAVLIADLRADLGDNWERLIARTAVAGLPVYHIKQVRESLTGRVEIEHLSENSFGSLIPNLGYLKVKRVLDLAVALVLFPVLLIPGLFVALAIKLESRGPVFFRQERRGHRDGIFKVVKFRTMIHRPSSGNTDREAAITLAGDARITRVGRFLRRTRIDELPQIWNILKGEMSWIGPRPEALSLSQWYMDELPFYTYRHIVRPGITGWAQVNQGHVADLEGVYEKLHYDFFYIKNFSAWLDFLILSKTISIVFSGAGAK